ncbi:MAG TPA: hypothetical protein VK435_01380 [Thermodesulfovibrionales bacterium]|nr:hypothetical protein [Thermodesulfovibrionales bacterium]
MKSILIILTLVFSVHLLSATNLCADPRMETNKEFCHFILDPNNTDNEMFMASCDSVITVVEKAASTTGVSASCEDSNRVASGYARVTKTLPEAALPGVPGSSFSFTSDQSDTPCTMVESNGRAYTSTKWRSVVKVGAKKKNGGPIDVQYELICSDGRQ